MKRFGYRPGVRTGTPRAGLRASWNPGMSEPNPSVEQALNFNPAEAFNPGAAPYVPGFSDFPDPVQAFDARSRLSGTAGIKGLTFSYRLQQWGPKNGPSMIPANAFPTGYIPKTGLSGLSSPLTWIESALGIESASDMLTDAMTNVNDSTDLLSPTQTQIETLSAQAANYGNATDATVQSKSQACVSEASGLLSSLTTLQQAALTLQTSIANAQNSTISDTDAQNLKTQSGSLLDQANAFVKSVTQLQSDVLALAKYAQSGPSAIQSIENTIGSTVTSSISTLTWILGGGALVYFLAPTFIPRLASGIRKARN